MIEASIAGLQCVLLSLYLSPHFSYRNEQAIAVYTFWVLVLRRSVPRYVSKLAVLMIWILIALVIVIPYIVHMKEGIYGNVGYCKPCNF